MACDSGEPIRVLEAGGVLVVRVLSLSSVLALASSPIVEERLLGKKRGTRRSTCSALGPDERGK